MSVVRRHPLGRDTDGSAPREVLVHLLLHRFVSLVAEEVEHVEPRMVIVEAEHISMTAVCERCTRLPYVITDEIVGGAHFGHVRFGRKRVGLGVEARVANKIVGFTKEGFPRRRWVGEAIEEAGERAVITMEEPAMEGLVRDILTAFGAMDDGTSHGRGASGGGGRKDEDADVRRWNDDAIRKDEVRWICAGADNCSDAQF